MQEETVNLKKDKFKFPDNLKIALYSTLEKDYALYLGKNIVGSFDDVEAAKAGYKNLKSALTNGNYYIIFDEDLGLKLEIL